MNLTLDEQIPLLALQRELTGPFAAGVLLWRIDRAELTGFGGELDRVMQMPGWTNVWTMPIQNRVDMLSTGVNTPVGIRVLGRNLNEVVQASEDIAAALNRLAGDDEAPPPGGRDGADEPQPRDDDIESLRDLASGAPVVRAVNDLFELAVEQRASDIHVEAMRSGLSVRLRVDGLLRPVPGPSGVLPQAVISRIKIVAGLNIAERRLPQDGAARLRIGRLELDVLGLD